MDFEKLKYFIMVVEKGTLSKAAISLNMTQPPLSMAIRNLEKELGLKLFERRGKRIHITETGKLFYVKGKELVNSAKGIIEEVREQDTGKRSTVTVGCSTIANLTIIPEVVQRIHERNNNIIIRVLEGNTAFILEQLRLHHMDIGLVRNIFDKGDLHTTALLTEPLYVALPPDHYLEKQESIELKELENDNFLMPFTSYGYGISDMILEGCQADDFTPNIIYWGTETLPMLNMVKNNLGIAFTPALFTKIKGFELPTLVKLKTPSIHAKLNLVSLKDSLQKSSTEQFLKITKEVIQEM